jgi:Uma2 family endonuclease
MSELLTETPPALDEAARIALDEAVERLVIEDDEPVGNIYSEKQMRLLTEPLYSSWTPPPDEDEPDEPRLFMAAANVGVFASVHQPPLVPDMFLSLDVTVTTGLPEKRHRTYLIWEFGKAPDVVVEVVSNRKGNELGSKLRDYARTGVPYYVVYDPEKELSQELLRVYELQGRKYRPRPDTNLPEVGLSLTLWQGRFENEEDVWLRWCDADGNLIPTGAERAAREAERAALEAERATLEAEARLQAQAQLRAETEARHRAEAEAAQLRAELDQLRQREA